MLQQWWRQPQQVWLRRALFQVHLWSGIALGLYIVVISVTGSLAVPRRELTQWWVPETVPAIAGRKILDGTALRARAQARFPHQEISAVFRGRLPRPRRGSAVTAAVEPTYHVRFRGPGRGFEHLFDPYSGRDLGDTLPATLVGYVKIIELHDNLLAGRLGEKLNGALAIAVTALLLTGLVMWWPGSRHWRRSLIVQRGATGRVFFWQLHGMLGFWSCLLLLLWTVTGIYFAYPAVLEVSLGWLYPPDSDAALRGEELIASLTSLHFGRFGGWGVRALWMLLGLIPAVLFISGAVVWWHRVLSPWLLRTRRAQAVKLTALGIRES